MGKPTPFTYPSQMVALVRRGYPQLGARRTAEITGVSVRTVYRWCRDLTDPRDRERTAAAAAANRERGERDRLEYNLRILESMSDEMDPKAMLAAALALKPPPPR